MNKKGLKLALSMALIISMLMVSCAPALAAASNITVYDAKYYGSKALKSVTCEFDWHTGSVDRQRLVLMTQRLRESYEDGAGYYGDLTNFGTYGSDFDDFDEVLSHDAAEGTFGIVSYSEEEGVKMGSTKNRRVFEFDDTDIPLDVDKTYYVYLWTYYSGHYYPDNFFCAIKVEDGKVSYSDSSSSDDDGFQTVEGEDPEPDDNDDIIPEPDDNDDIIPEPPVMEVPKTGDGFNMALCILMLMVGCAGMASVMFRKRREDC